MAKIRREFLGWDEPPLYAAAKLLVSRFRVGGDLDLSNVVIVVPGLRAGRRLLELLAISADEQKWLLTPPLTITEGSLPEKLYSPKKQFASEMLQWLAWSKALRELPASERRHILPHPPAEIETARWLHLGKQLSELHFELAADGLSFDDVRDRAGRLPGFNERSRWDALVAARDRYLSILDRLELWDKQTARLVAIRQREIHTEKEIILLGASDLNDALRQMLAQIPERVTACITAPETHSDLFDDYGCVITERWLHHSIPLRSEQILPVDRQGEQADAVADWLSRISRRYRLDEAVIGAADAAFVPQLQRCLEQLGQPARWFEGARIDETAPYRLIAAAVRFAERRRYEDFAALFRHPDIEDWLGSGISLIPALDEYYNRCLPSRIDSNAASRMPLQLAEATVRIEKWLDGAAARQPLRVWADVFRRLLAEIYGGRTLKLTERADYVAYEALTSILAACESLGAIPANLDEAPLGAVEALRIALAPHAANAVPAADDPNALEILGWLELPLDDSPALVVTSFNEGFVPKSAGADSFLPDQLRRDLGILHNDRRYARDAFATTVLAQSRQDLLLIAPRFDAKGDPVQPSRLLFACPNDALIERARQFFGAKATVRPVRQSLFSEVECLEQSLLAPPKPKRTATPMDRLRVSDFKLYLACPYRFYLKRIEQLETVGDTERELDGSRFGNLLHSVLAAFGNGPLASRLDASFDEIVDCLDALLTAHVAELFGSVPRKPAVLIQLEAARQRLRNFAAKQAALVRDGWRLVYAEPRDAAKLEKTFLVDHSSVIVVGSIDRIDWHAGQGKLRILDYKTGDTAKDPAKAHRERDCWVDLQLPLYRHLWRQTGISIPDDCAIELGYFNLPKVAAETDVRIAEWDASALADADGAAVSVMRDILAQRFWPPEVAAPEIYSEFAAICRDHVTGRPRLPDEEEEAP